MPPLLASVNFSTNTLPEVFHSTVFQGLDTRLNCYLQGLIFWMLPWKQQMIAMLLEGPLSAFEVHE